MILCDQQLFWHHHYKRPRLYDGFNLSRPSYREVMQDDGTIIHVGQEAGYTLMRNAMNATFAQMEEDNRKIIRSLVFNKFPRAD